MGLNNSHQNYSTPLKKKELFAIPKVHPSTSYRIDEIDKRILYHLAADAVLTPRGDTVIEAGDVVTVFSPESVSERIVEAFETELPE